MSDPRFASSISVPPRPRVILRPGIPSLPPGVERYRVKGGGSAVVPVSAGDEITVTDLEGLQPCRLVAAGADGRYDAGILGVHANERGDELRDALGDVAARLKDRKLDLSRVEGVRIFGESSRAGDQARFTVARDGILI